MPKRAQRRHHEERVKAKFKKVAERQVGDVNGWINRWEWGWEDGKWVGKPVVDRTGAVKRIRIVEKSAVKMAHHPRHQCQICRMGPKEAKRKHEFEAAKKRPFNEEKDDDQEE